ncbi:D-alanyl-lipoteichoic acid biosynthesis protein DltB [Macrococcus equi]|uniref:D-alanyl-lipoteichoic acid biosynthesis protein DltB n=1 Tax=Macrococcus equi TaxID=3395462 RepID=UPI0039BEBFD1
MIPYGDFPFFLIALIILLPIIILGIFGRKNIHLNFVATLIMIVLIFKDDTHFLFVPYLSYALLSLAVFVLLQIVLIKLYIKIAVKKNTLPIFIAVLLFSILPLIIVKVLQSSLLGLSSWMIYDTPAKNIFGFLGISYIMFKCIQIILEVRDKRIKSMNTYNLLRFLLFFPTISSGPIDRYKRFLKDEAKPLTKERYSDLLSKAIHYIFIGFLYKYIIAYLINTYIINTIHFDTDPFIYKLGYMYAYAFYLFFDFAGYSLFAIAFSYLLSIETPPNFNKPFLAKNIKDFWNRWHMSLSFWFRDMIYMRFVFFMSKKKYIKNNLVISNIGFMINFMVMGIWHGIEWFYIVYGLYHGILFVLYSYYEQWKKKHPLKIPAKVMDVIGIIVTFHIVAFGFLIFSGKLF